MPFWLICSKPLILDNSMSRPNTFSSGASKKVSSDFLSSNSCISLVWPDFVLLTRGFGCVEVIFTAKKWSKGGFYDGFRV